MVSPMERAKDRWAGFRTGLANFRKTIVWRLLARQKKWIIWMVLTAMGAFGGAAGMAGTFRKLVDQGVIHRTPPGSLFVGRLVFPAFWRPAAGTAFPQINSRGGGPPGVE